MDVENTVLKSIADLPRGSLLTYEQAEKLIGIGYRVHSRPDRKNEFGEIQVLLDWVKELGDHPPLGLRKSYRLYLPKKRYEHLFEKYEKVRERLKKEGLPVISTVKTPVSAPVPNTVPEKAPEENTVLSDNTVSLDQVVKMLSDISARLARLESKFGMTNPESSNIMERICKLEGMLEAILKMRESKTEEEIEKEEVVGKKEGEEVELSIDLEKLREGFIKATEIVTEATGRRIIADPHILLYYGFAISHLGFKGDLADFIREQIIDHHRDHGIELAFVIRKER